MAMAPGDGVGTVSMGRWSKPACGVGEPRRAPCRARGSERSPGKGSLELGRGVTAGSGSAEPGSGLERGRCSLVAALGTWALRWRLGTAGVRQQEGCRSDGRQG